MNTIARYIRQLFNSRLLALHIVVVPSIDNIVRGPSHRSVPFLLAATTFLQSKRRQIQ